MSSSVHARVGGLQLARGSVTGRPLLPGRTGSGSGSVIVEDRKLTFGDSVAVFGGCCAGSLHRGLVLSREGRLDFSCSKVHMKAR